MNVHPYRRVWIHMWIFMWEERTKKKKKKEKNKKRSRRVFCFRRKRLSGESGKGGEEKKRKGDRMAVHVYTHTYTHTERIPRTMDTEGF